jgi:LytS/YehU family sensor histidine kinase
MFNHTNEPKAASDFITNNITAISGTIGGAIGAGVGLGINFLNKKYPNTPTTTQLAISSLAGACLISPIPITLTQRNPLDLQQFIIPTAIAAGIGSIPTIINQIHHPNNTINIITHITAFATIGSITGINSFDQIINKIEQNNPPKALQNTRRIIPQEIQQDTQNET